MEKKLMLLWFLFLPSTTTPLQQQKINKQKRLLVEVKTPGQLPLSPHNVKITPIARHQPPQFVRVENGSVKVSIIETHYE